MVPHIPVSSPWGWPQGPGRGYRPPVPITQPPLVGPGWTGDIDGSGGTTIGTTPWAPPVPRAVPHPGVRERKVPNNTAAGRAVVSAFRGLGHISEAGDLLDNLWKNIPYKYRRRDHSPSRAEKMKDLWDNWDKVNLLGAAKDIALNEIEDNIVGNVTSAARRAANLMDPTGTLWRTAQTAASLRRGQDNRARLAREERARNRRIEQRADWDHQRRTRDSWRI